MSQLTPSPENEAELSDTESASSSVVYEQKPFETFRVLVLEFAQDLWNESSADDIKVERMSGEGFNHIIGISRKLLGQEKSDEYVLRIPRFDAARLDRDVAALHFVRQLGGIPVPDVVAFDETSNNKLDSPYMIQNRIPGTELFTTYPTLDHSNKCQIAADLGHVFHRMLSAKSAVAGVFCLPSNSRSSEVEPHHVTIAPFFEMECDAARPERKTEASVVSQKNTLGLLNDTFNARKADGLKHYPSDTLRPKLMDQFVTMASELESDGWLKDVPFSLCHLDLAPRNILISRKAASLDQSITGILDWDSAILAPSFMSCAPPLWIWAWSDDEDEDERTANDAPPTEEGKALKSIFEEAAGHEYMRYAYSPAYRLARRLVRFAVDGIRSSEDVDEAEAMLQEWTEMRQALKDAY